MSCKIDSFVIANTLGTSNPEILTNLEYAGRKTFLTESNEYFNDRKIFIGKTSLDLSGNEKDTYGITDRNSQFLLWTYLQLKDRVEFLKRKFGCSRIGMLFGTSTSGIYNLENAVLDKENGVLPSSYQYSCSEPSFFTNSLKKWFGITGPSYTISTSCTSGLKAVSSAKNLLDCGMCDAVITGGIDTLCRLTIKGFDSLELLSKSIANPMSVNRDGINIGEGVAVCILTGEAGGIQIKGIGETCDTYHVSSPDPDGTGAMNSMIMAMKNANLSKEEIHYIQLHGTGTNFNDISEARAIYNIWENTVGCSSIKPLTGHTLGISGIMGVLIGTLILEQERQRVFAPVHVWDGCKDEQIADIKLLDSNTAIPGSDSLNFMINNFAFGGNNCSIIIGKDL